MRVSMAKNIWSLGLLLVSSLMLALFISLMSTSKVSAFDSWSGTQGYMRSPNVLNAYVNSNERLHINFELTGVFEGENAPTEIVVLQPSDSGSSTPITLCSIPGGDIPSYIPPEDNAGLPDISCRTTPGGLSSSVSGVWTIKFLKDGREIVEDGNIYLLLFKWQVEVKRPGVVEPIRGRVWTETLSLIQTSGSPNLQFWYVSEYGYVYSATYGGYYGIDSAFYADSHGLVKDSSTCEIIYGSTATSGAVQDAKACSSSYHLFFDGEPNPDMPTTAKNHSGSDIWVLPEVPANPSIDDINFTADTEGKARGVLTYVVSDYSGGGVIEVSATVDGVPRGSQSYNVGITDKSSGGINTFYFDGYIDGDDISGREIILNFKITINERGSIHFVNIDAERRSGGLVVQRLNGSSSHRDVLFWDDRSFPLPGKRCSNPGSANHFSLDGNIRPGNLHSWGTAGCVSYQTGLPSNGNDNRPEDLNEGSWGDNRNIHDWTYDLDARYDVDKSFELTVYDRPYLKSFGGEVHVGGTFRDGSNCTYPDNTGNKMGQINTFAWPNNSGKYAGASNQLTVSAFLGIDGFYSRSADAGSNPKKLTFANTGSGFGGYSHRNRCMTDYYSKAPADSVVDSLPPFYAHQGIQRINLGSDKAIGNFTIPAGTQVAIFIDGDVTINGDIVFGNGATSFKELPNLYIIAKGNIYIDRSVNRLDGTYIAQGGTIYTCTNDSTLFSKNSLANSCNSQLVINGSIMAQDIEFLRTWGSLSSTSGTSEQPDYSDGSGTEAAEVVNYTPEVYLAPNPLSSTTTGGGGSGVQIAPRYESIYNLNPIF